MDFKSHIWKKKKKPGLVLVRPGPGSSWFGQAVVTAGLLLNPDRSSHQIDSLDQAGFNNSASDALWFLSCPFLSYKSAIAKSSKKEARRMTSTIVKSWNYCTIYYSSSYFFFFTIAGYWFKKKTQKIPKISRHIN
jgi:hypothetical protein